MMFIFIFIGITISLLLLLLTIKEYVIPRIKPQMRLYILARKNKKMYKAFTNRMKELEIK